MRTSLFRIRQHLLKLPFQFTLWCCVPTPCVVFLWAASPNCALHDSFCQSVVVRSVATVAFLWLIENGLMDQQACRPLPHKPASCTISLGVSAYTNAQRQLSSSHTPSHTVRQSTPEIYRDKILFKSWFHWFMWLQFSVILFWHWSHPPLALISATWKMRPASIFRHSFWCLLSSQFNCRHALWTSHCWLPFHIDELHLSVCWWEFGVPPGFMLWDQSPLQSVGWVGNIGGAAPPIDIVDWNSCSACASLIICLRKMLSNTGNNRHPWWFPTL